MLAAALAATELPSTLGKNRIGRSDASERKSTCSIKSDKYKVDLTLINSSRNSRECKACASEY